ncbi:hypothetical protein H8K52_08755 [Undibacterium seohonense]|jgi:hypothetical protein|uniref:Uncharacterized protein n=1 Tax=Undibacterium seohonense TaxID=1344950 RepID=A0ABR6X3S4_9BURK|nr:hypothetical protein [Undibacterium seohonense]MBC3807431.1 hypothetical protein [Undibacterium seohonense]
MTFFRRFKQFFVTGLVTSFVACGLLSTGAAQAERGPATAEEGERIVKLAAVADKDPLAAMSSAEGRWFQKWADDVPDYMFGPDKGVFWFHNGVAKGDLMRVLRFHHTVSTAAFQLQKKIKDPMRNEADNEAKTLAGVEGVLRAYESLVAKSPDNRVPAIDDLIAARNKGGLAELVKKMPHMPSR